MSDKDRWVLFLLVTISILWIMQWQTIGRRKQQTAAGQTTAQQAGADQTSTGTLTRGTDSSTSLALQLSETRASSGTLTRAKGAIPKELLAGEDKFIEVKTSRMQTRLTNRGGRPVSWQLFLHHNLKEHDSVEIVELIPQVEGRASDELPLEVSFKQFNNADFHQLNRVLFESEVRTPDASTTIVLFTSPVIDEMQLIKQYRFASEGYLTELSVELRNLSASRVNIENERKGVTLSWGPGIHQFSHKLNTQADLWYINTFSAQKNKFIYFNPKDPEGKNWLGSKSGNAPLEANDVRWGGLQDKFFAVILIPAQQSEPWSSRSLLREKNRIIDPAVAELHSPPYTYEILSQSFNLQPAGEQNSNRTLAYQIYTGPIEPDTLAQASQQADKFVQQISSKSEPVQLKRLIFYNSWFWMRALCFGLLKVLNMFHGLTGSWGLAIILLTISVKLVTHPLNHTALKHQAIYGEQIRKVKPELDALNLKYQGDTAKRSQEMMKLFKKHNISQFGPLKGCLPMLIQAPVLFGLYRICSQTWSLRGAEFLFVQNLAQPDELISFAKLTFGAVREVPLLGDYFNILPVLMGLTQFLISRYASTTQPTDPNQKMIIYMMPFIMTFMLFKLPSGLFVYWIVSNMWQFAHTFQARKQVHDRLEQSVDETRAVPRAAIKEK